MFSYKLHVHEYLINCQIRYITNVIRQTYYKNYAYRVKSKVMLTKWSIISHLTL